MNSSKGIPIGAAVLVAFAVWAVSAVILETAGEGAAWNIAWYLVGLPILAATAFVGAHAGGRRLAAPITGFAMGVALTASIVLFSLSLGQSGLHGGLAANVVFFVVLSVFAGTVLWGCAALGEAFVARRSTSRR
jgi:hypothetical protein